MTGQAEKGTVRSPRIPFRGEACWIWCPQAEVPADGSVALAAVFSRSFTAPAQASMVVHVSADSSYRLWMNGHLAGRGPARGDPAHWPYDSLELGPWLTEGDNTLQVEVVCFAPVWPDYIRGGPPVSVMTSAPGLILEGFLNDPEGREVLHLVSDDQWLARQAHGVLFDRRPGVPCAGLGELCRESMPWNLTASEAYPALEVTVGGSPETISDSIRPHRLIARRTAPLRERATTFDTVWDINNIQEPVSSSAVLEGQWFEVARGQHGGLLLDAGAMATGYPVLELEGTGVVRLYYGERLTSGGRPVRDGSQQHDPLEGPMWDEIAASGVALKWQPFIWRAFRFVRIEAVAGDTVLRIRMNGFLLVHYPYPDIVPFRSSNPEHTWLDSCSDRTLRLCSHDTFEDCPYFERLQYAGDVQIQARSAYWMTGDTALAKQAVLQFAESVTPDGLTASRWPSRVPQVIPLWSAHWILAVHEFVAYTGDVAVVRACLPAMLGVLRWFLTHRRADGLIGKLPHWMVADWSPDWPGGIPPGADSGPSALVHFLVLAAIRATHVCCEVLGERGEAKRLALEADKLSLAVRRAFWSEAKGYYRDQCEGPIAGSRLTNAWAILARVTDPDQEKLILHALDAGTDLCRESWFGSCFAFDACMQGRRYDLAERLLVPYRSLRARGFTTWPEDLEATRSECHGWSNLPGMAMRRLYLGVRLDSIGCRRLRIEPWAGTLTFAEGVVPLPQGPLSIRWQREGDRMDVEINLPEGVNALLAADSASPEILPPGRSRHLISINKQA